MFIVVVYSGSNNRNMSFVKSGISVAAFFVVVRNQVLSCGASNQLTLILCSIFVGPYLYTESATVCFKKYCPSMQYDCHLTVVRHDVLLSEHNIRHTDFLGK